MIELPFEAAQIKFEFCQKHQMYDLGGYVHCHAAKTGKYTLYEGGWGESKGGYCEVVQLQVIRNATNAPIIFQSLEEAYTWAKEHGRLSPEPHRQEAQQYSND